MPLFVLLGVASSAFLSLHGLSQGLRFWEATRVDVVGNHVLQAPEVEASASLGPHIPWIFLQSSQIEARLERNPWVAVARVRRTFWRGVLIRIEERDPQAVCSWHSGLAEMDVEGHLLPLTGGRVPGDLPMLTGVELDSLQLGARTGDVRVRAALEFLARCRASRRELWRHVSELALGEPGKVRLRLSDSNAEVWLRPEALSDTRMALLDTVLPDVQQHQQEVSVVDLRFNGMVVLKPREAATGAAKTS